MSKSALYIGGFGNGRRIASRIARSETMERTFPEGVKYCTFAQAMQNPEDIQDAVKRIRNVITHSAGLLALMRAEAYPEYLEAYGAPIPLSAPKLVGRTDVKTLRMVTPGLGIKALKDVPAVLQWNGSAIAELAVHPSANLRHLGAISKFNAFEAVDSILGQTEAHLFYNEGDAYYRPDEVRAMSETYPGITYIMLPGEHDELALRPDATLLAAAFGPEEA